MQPLHVPHLDEFTSIETRRLTTMQTQALCERINDILKEFHALRNSGNTGLSSLTGSRFSSRLLASSMPLDEDHVKQMILSKLSSEQDIANEVASGRKDIAEAMNVDFIAENFEESMREELVVLSEDITAALLAAAVDELAEELEDMEQNNTRLK